jgi:hypothetical protein
MTPWLQEFCVFRSVIHPVTANSEGRTGLKSSKGWRMINRRKRPEKSRRQHGVVCGGCRGPYR